MKNEAPLASEVTELHLLRLIRELADESADTGVAGKFFAWLSHETEEGNPLEENQEAWQAWIRELLDSEELRVAVQEEIKARILLSETLPVAKQIVGVSSLSKTGT
jgi:hypothetical protein